MSDVPKERIGPGNPPEEHRFKKGTSGNPRGRPPKHLSLLVPSELRRIFLAILDEVVEAPTPAGPKHMTILEVLLRNLTAQATKGKPTALNHVMRLLIPLLSDRMSAHPEVLLAEFLRGELEKPQPENVSRKMVAKQIKATKGKY